MPAATARELARALRESPAAAVYARTGSCLGRHGTLVAFLLDAVAAATGNLDALEPLVGMSHLNGIPVQLYA